MATLAMLLHDRRNIFGKGHVRRPGDRKRARVRRGHPGDLPQQAGSSAYFEREDRQCPLHAEPTWFD
jgi:hypothetical protein